MQALSMIDMGAKTPEIVAPVKSVETQGKQFGKVLGEQRQPEPAEGNRHAAQAQKAENKSRPEQTQKMESKSRPEQAQNAQAEQQPTEKQDAVATLTAGKQPASQPAAEPQLVADVAPKLQQIVIDLMKVIAGGETPELTEEFGATEELVKQLVQQLDGSELKGEQVLAGIDMSALVEQLQALGEEGGEEPLMQLVAQIESQLVNPEQSIIESEGGGNTELAAALLSTSDPQAVAPKLVENLAQARQILQKAINAVTTQQTPATEGEEPAAVSESEVPSEELLFAADAAEEVDPRFAGLLKPRSNNQPQPGLREQMQGSRSEPKAAPLPANTEGVVPAAEINSEQTKVTELSESLANNPKQAFENLVQPAQNQANPSATTQPQNVTGKLMPETPTVQLPSGQQVAESQIFDQVVARFTGSLNGESGRMVLRLQPAELGSLKIELQVEGDRIRANINAQSIQVQEVIERNLPQLRNALAEQGLKIDQFQVEVNRDQSGQGQFDQMAQQQQRQDSQQRNWQQPTEIDEQIIPLAHLLQNGGGGISLHV